MHNGSKIKIVTPSRHVVLETLYPNLAASDLVVSARIIEYAKLARPAINIIDKGIKNDARLKKLKLFEAVLSHASRYDAEPVILQTLPTSIK